MSSSEPTVTVTDDPSEHRFVARLDGGIAGFVTYRPAGGSLVLLHTEVAPEFEGKGVAGRLVRGLLDQVRERGGTVRNECPYIDHFLSEHPDYRDLLAN